MTHENARPKAETEFRSSSRNNWPNPSAEKDFEKAITKLKKLSPARQEAERKTAMNPRQRHRRAALSLRPPQRRSLEILDRISGDRCRPRRGRTSRPPSRAIRSEFPTVTDFEREFPSLCFALATGVGKTRLMGPSSATCTWPTASATSSSSPPT